MAGQSDLTRKLVADGLFRNQRADSLGPLRILARAEGYVMVRRPGCVPFVITETSWNAMQLRGRAA